MKSILPTPHRRRSPSSPPRIRRRILVLGIESVPGVKIRLLLAREMDSFKIMVSVSADDVNYLDVNSTTTIQQVITNIPSLTDAPLNYLLLFRGRNLLDHPSATLAQSGIEDRAHFVVSRKGLFSVRVRAGRSYSFFVYVETLDTVLDLKEKIRAQTDISAEKQDLYYCFNLMADNASTLASYGMFHPGAAPTYYDHTADFGKYTIKLHTDCRMKRMQSQLAYWRFAQQGLVYNGESPPSSSDIKILVEMLASYRANVFRLHIKSNPMDTINSVKTKICNMTHSNGLDSFLTFIAEGKYVLLFRRKLLESDSSTLDECGINDEDSILLCPSCEFTITVVIVLAQEPTKMYVHPVSVRCYETVGILKQKIRDLASISTEKQILLRFQKKWLAEDHDLLMVHGILKLPPLTGSSSLYSRGRDTFIVEALTYGA